MDRTIKNISICLIVVALTFAFQAQAAQISFDPSATTLSVGDTLTMQVRLDTQGASINAVDLGILYPGILSVKSISKSGSFVQIWVREPSYSKDAVFLSGGLPGGINSGNGLVATVTFEAKAVGQGSLGLSPASSVLLNDGSGTNAPLSLRTPPINVVPRKAGQPASTQAATATTSKKDTTSPDGFQLFIGTDSRLFGGKYFISFFTVDNGSGVDHYELKEGNRPYVIARSPFLLADQNLHSVIHVRAYDTAGNYREETYPGIFKRFWWWITDHLKL